MIYSLMLKFILPVKNFFKPQIIVPVHSPAVKQHRIKNTCHFISIQMNQKIGFFIYSNSCSIHHAKKEYPSLFYF